MPPAVHLQHLLEWLNEVVRKGGPPAGFGAVVGAIVGLVNFPLEHEMSPCYSQYGCDSVFDIEAALKVAGLALAVAAVGAAIN